MVLLRELEYHFMKNFGFDTVAFRKHCPLPKRFYPFLPLFGYFAINRDGDM